MKFKKTEYKNNIYAKIGLTTNFGIINNPDNVLDKVEK